MPLTVISGKDTLATSDCNAAPVVLTPQERQACIAYIVQQCLQQYAKEYAKDGRNDYLELYQEEVLLPKLQETAKQKINSLSQKDIAAIKALHLTEEEARATHPCLAGISGIVACIFCWKVGSKLTTLASAALGIEKMGEGLVYGSPIGLGFFCFNLYLTCRRIVEESKKGKKMAVEIPYLLDKCAGISCEIPKPWQEISSLTMGAFSALGGVFSMFRGNPLTLLNHEVSKYLQGIIFNGLVSGGVRFFHEKVDANNLQLARRAFSGTNTYYNIYSIGKNLLQVGLLGLSRFI